MSNVVQVSPDLIINDLNHRCALDQTPCGDGIMVWRKWGSGPTLVFLHGAHGSWGHWIRNILHFSERYTVWAPDLPGYGDSDVPNRLNDPYDFATAIAGGLYRLFTEEIPLIVVGFSLGGVLAAHVAALAPDLMKRLILVDTGGLDTPLGEMPTTSIRGLTKLEDITFAHRQNLLAVMIHNPENVDSLALHLQATNVALARVDPRPLIMPNRLQSVLQLSKTPVDAIWGEWDRPHPNPERQREALNQLRPDVQFRVIKGAGHWSMYESAQSFNHTLDELLTMRQELQGR